MEGNEAVDERKMEMNQAGERREMRREISVGSRGCAVEPGVVLINRRRNEKAEKGAVTNQRTTTRGRCIRPHTRTTFIGSLVLRLSCSRHGRSIWPQ